MLSAVLGLFSQDLAVDLGTAHTRLWLRGQGVVLDEPTLLAVHTDPRGRRRVLAVGAEARPMLERAPKDIQLVRPVRDGHVHDFEAAEAYLLHLVRRVHGRNGWMSPRMVVTVPPSITDIERRAVRESCEAAGAREVHLVSRPLAAALGCDLPVDQPSGHLVVDLGAGSTEITVLSMRGVVTSDTVPGGGDAMDDAVVAWVRDQHQLLVGRPTAEAVKIRLGDAVAGRSGEAAVAGRCLERHIPRAVTLGSPEVRAALAPSIGAIAERIRGALERTPPELLSDILDNGVILTGGGSRLRGLDVALRDLTGLPVVAADPEARAVITGAGRVLEDPGMVRALAA